MSGQRTNDPYDRPPVDGKFNMENADRYDDPSVDPRATGPGSGFGLAEGQQARETGARLQASGTQGGPGGLASHPGQNLPQQTSGGRSAQTDAKIAQNAAQGLQSGDGSTGGATGGSTGGAGGVGGGVGGAQSGQSRSGGQTAQTGQRDPYDRAPVDGKFNMENADRYDDPSVDPRATGPGSGFGLATGQQARETDARLAGQGQQQQGQQHQSQGQQQGQSQYQTRSTGTTGTTGGVGGVGGVGGTQTGAQTRSQTSAQSGAQSGGQRDPYDRAPVDGKFNMENADRYDDPSVDPRATGPGSGFGLATGQQAREADARLQGQGQQGQQGR